MMEFSLSSALLIFVFLLLEALYSGSELALLSVDRLHLKKLAKQNHRGAALALKLLKAPERILSVTLLMTSTCVMGSTVVLTLELNRTIGEQGEFYAVMIGSTLVVIFGELLPKFLFRKFAEDLAPRIAPLIFFSQKLFSPVLSILSVYTSQVSKVIQPIERIWGGKKQDGKEDLNTILTSDSSESNIKVAEKRLLKQVLKFRDRIAKDAIVPLVQVDAIESDAQLLDALKLFSEKKHSRLPIFEDRVDNIIGVLELGSVIRENQTHFHVQRFMKAPYYVAETQTLETILSEMLKRDEQLAIVVDEYGGALGILTREDIFEQIVGELEDEDDRAHPKSIRPLALNRWLVRANVRISELNDSLALDLPEGDYDTVSGFLMRQFSRIPEQNDELFFDTRAGQIHFIVKESSPRKVESVVIERIPSSM